MGDTSHRQPARSSWGNERQTCRKSRLLGMPELQPASNACTAIWAARCHQSALVQGAAAGTGTGTGYHPTGTGTGYGATNTATGHSAPGNPPYSDANTGYNNSNTGFSNQTQPGHQTQPMSQGYATSQAKTGHATDGTYGSTAAVSMHFTQVILLVMLFYCI